MTPRNEPESVTEDLPRRRRRGSLFFRLPAVLLGMVLLTLVLLGFFFRTWWNPDVRDSTRRNLRQYAELLSHEIGTPPDTVKAKELSNRLRLGIAVRDASGHWWFAPRVPEVIRERILTRERETGFGAPKGPGESADSVRVQYSKGRMLAVIPLNGYTFLYGSRRRQTFESGPWEWLFLFGGLAGLWLLAWLFVRRQLMPLRDLARGVAAVERGDLESRLPERGTDEFTDLARSFNAMTHSLKERLLARDQLLLDVSHELRSPLTRMRVALEMAEPGSAVDSLREEVVALETMVSEILETERLNSPAGGVKREWTDVNALIDAKLARFEEASSGILRTGSPLPPLRVDEERLRQVLRNLLENAVKYGGDSGRPVELSTRVEAGRAVISVRDWGPGVPESERRLIFEPFYRTDRSRSVTSGYGLGLPLCKRIVEAHGGTISFESRPGEGSTVTVRLPLEDKK
jgi:signal transduction histidine kinase